MYLLVQFNFKEKSVHCLEGPTTRPGVSRCSPDHTDEVEGGLLFLFPRKLNNLSPGPLLLCR